MYLVKGECMRTKAINIEISKDDIRVDGIVAFVRRGNIYEQMKDITSYLLLEIVEYIKVKNTLGKLDDISYDYSFIYYDFRKATLVVRWDRIIDDFIVKI
jgi:hypothetical protein